MGISSYELDVVYVQREKLHCLLYYKNISSKRFQEQKSSLRDIFVYHFLVHICLFLAANLL